MSIGASGRRTWPQLILCWVGIYQKRVPSPRLHPPQCSQGFLCQIQHKPGARHIWKPCRMWTASWVCWAVVYSAYTPITLLPTSKTPLGNGTLLRITALPPQSETFSSGPDPWEPLEAHGWWLLTCSLCLSISGQVWSWLCFKMLNLSQQTGYTVTYSRGTNHTKPWWLKGAGIISQPAASISCRGSPQYNVNAVVNTT